MLSDHDILKALKDGSIHIDPLDYALIQPSSVDVRMDKYLRLFDTERYKVIDPAVDQGDLTRQVELNERYLLRPGEFVLASTHERVELGPMHAARLEGKSSLGRLGLVTHSTAGFIDPGFRGTITLELANISPMPMWIYPGMKIGQLCFFKLDSPCLVPYGTKVIGSHYQDQPAGPVASRAYKGFTSW